MHKMSNGNSKQRVGEAGSDRMDKSHQACSTNRDAESGVGEKVHPDTRQLRVNMGDGIWVMTLFQNVGGSGTVEKTDISDAGPRTVHLCVVFYTSL